MQVRLRGVVAATNFSLSEYRSELADYHRKQQVVLLIPATFESLHAIKAAIS